MKWCPVPGCADRRRAGNIMCREHWRMVPAELRRRIWANYRAVNARTCTAATKRCALAAIREAIKAVSGPLDDVAGDFANG